MSGGVDSSVAAALLVHDGLSVIGLHMALHQEPSAGLARARQVCERLGIPLHTVDLRPEFREGVVGKFAAAYRAGRTPNPCLSCNPEIKFGVLLERARELYGAWTLATGHYARLSAPADGDQRQLLRGADRDKEQSYFLALVPRSRLSYLSFPLGGLRKSRVRELAADLRFWAELPAESQEVCFLGGADYRSLLAGMDSPGDIVDLAGNVLGRHGGVWRYTIGQRRGLGVAGKRPLYVKALDVAANRVVVAAGDEAPFTSMVVGELNWLSHPRSELRCTVRSRYRQTDQACTATLGADGTLSVVFDRPQQALAAGQGAVFYQGERVLAGGIIEAAS
jgi:tRNA-specific 2-thiouridylase